MDDMTTSDIATVRHKRNFLDWAVFTVGIGSLALALALSLATPSVTIAGEPAETAANL